MDASSWKRAGKSNTYTFNEGGVSGKITYWSGGTSRCLFSFNPCRLRLQGSLPNLPSLPVRLRLGGGFDETVRAEMVVKNTVAKLSYVGPLPAFVVDRVAMTRNLRQSGRDVFKLSGRLFLTRDFDPASDAVLMFVGAYTGFFILPGSMPAAKNGLINYSEPTANGKLTIRLNLKNNTLVVTATGIDLSRLTPEVNVSLAIGNPAGANWAYGLFLGVNKAGTAYKY